MAYGNFFPASYQQSFFGPPVPFYPQQQAQQAQNPPQTQAAQMMTPPTIRAEIVQVDNEEAAERFPVGIGSSQMMIAKDDSAIFVKTASANGYTLDVFEKRPPAPPAPVFDPSAFVRRDEINELISAALAASVSKSAPQRAKQEKGSDEE